MAWPRRQEDDDGDRYVAAGRRLWRGGAQFSPTHGQRVWNSHLWGAPATAFGWKRNRSRAFQVGFRICRQQGSGVGVADSENTVSVDPVSTNRPRYRQPRGRPHGARHRLCVMMTIDRPSRSRGEGSPLLEPHQPCCQFVGNDPFGFSAMAQTPTRRAWPGQRAEPVGKIGRETDKGQKTLCLGCEVDVRRAMDPERFCDRSPTFIRGDSDPTGSWNIIAMSRRIGFMAAAEVVDALPVEMDSPLRDRLQPVSCAPAFFRIRSPDQSECPPVSHRN